MRATIGAALAALGILGGQILEQMLNAGAPSLPLLSALRKLGEPGSVYEQRSAQVPYAEYLRDHAAELIAGRIATAIGYFALAYALTFLAAAIRARRPEFARWAFYLPVVSGVLFGVAWIAGGVGRLLDANQVIDGDGTIGSVQDLGSAGV